MKEDKSVNTNEREIGAIDADELADVTGGKVPPPYSRRKPLQPKEPFANDEVAEANKQEKF